MEYAKDGYQIQPGDLIESKSWTGIKRFPVYRVTKTMAFVRWNEKADGKFPRVFKAFGFNEKPRPKWSTIQYRVLVNDKNSAD